MSGLIWFPSEVLDLSRVVCDTDVDVDVDGGS